MVDIPGEPFFRPDGDLLVPAPHANSPWSPQMMHGRLFGGLLARSLELEHASEEFQFARLTVDLFRSAELAPVRVETQRVRDGRRIRVADATVLQGDKVVARASAVLLRQGEQPDGDVPTTPPWPMPTTAELGPPAGAAGQWEPPFDVWMLDESGAPTDWAHPGARRAWLRDIHDLVEGEPMSPFVRTATAADFASPLANMPKGGALGFINADYTLTLSRMPSTPEIGVEATGHLSHTGIATASTTFHDPEGPFGYCTVTAVANPPMS
ncbi:thioesterase family protein [Saccharopolyspora rhizosphaerae]|uniref:Thioesterase family protein n=1 Tax=Saccharopolyspora rhizosphaerae TaxID=2492662 RepID=A0A426JM33_9PSEU|nr:acyl-CoA thioesterase domain-containing protein [Saccharopolyspora rhizosphaerae]RRO14289.1 thioesterase family protein [Saccharopolyspora rhizosphaerae]